MKKSVLVIGGAGFLGSHLVSELINNYRVIVLERKGSNMARIASFMDAIEIIYDGEVDAASYLLLSKINFIVNCAVIYGQNDFLSDQIYNNVVKPLTWLEACNQHSQAFINIDSFFNKPENQNYTYLHNYILTKKHLEEYLSFFTKDIRIINMKLEHLYGPGDNYEKFIPSMINRILNHDDDIQLTDGDQLRDFIYVKDAVQGIITVIQKINEIKPGFTTISVGTGRATSIKEVINLIKSITGSPSKLNFGTLPYRENEIMKSIGDPEFLSYLGWKCSYNLESGITEMINLRKKQELRTNNQSM